MDYGLEFYFKIKQAGLEVIDKLNQKINIGQKALAGLNQALQETVYGYDKLKASLKDVKIQPSGFQTRYIQAFEASKIPVNKPFNIPSTQPAIEEGLSLKDKIAGGISAGALVAEIKAIDDAMEALRNRMVQLGFTGQDVAQAFQEMQKLKIERGVIEGFEEAIYYLTEYGVGLGVAGQNSQKLMQALAGLAEVSAKSARIFGESVQSIAEANYQLAQTGFDIYNEKALKELWSGFLALKQLGFNITIKDITEALREFQQVSLLVSKQARGDFLLAMTTMDAFLKSQFTSMKELGMDKLITGLLKNSREATNQLALMATTAGMGIDKVYEIQRALREGTPEQMEQAMTDLFGMYKALYQQMEQARQMGVPVEILEQRYGVEYEALSKLVAKEDEFREKLRKVYEEKKRGKLLDEAYSRATQTLSDQWDKFLSNIGALLKSVFAPTINLLAVVLSKVNSVLGVLVSGFTKFMEILPEPLKVLTSLALVGGFVALKFLAIRGVLTLLGRGLGTVISSLALTQKGFAGIRALFFSLTGINLLLKGFTFMKDLLIAIVSFAGRLAGFFAGIGRAILPFITSLSGLGSVLTTIFSVVGRALLFVITKLNPVMFVITTIATIGYLAYKNWDKLKGVLATIWEGIKNIAGFISDVASSVGKAFLDAISSVAGNIQNLFVNVWEGIKNLALSFLSPIVELYNKIAGVVGLPTIQLPVQQQPQLPPSATATAPTAPPVLPPPVPSVDNSQMILLLQQQNQILAYIADVLSQSKDGRARGRSFTTELYRAWGW